MKKPQITLQDYEDRYNQKFPEKFIKIKSKDKTFIYFECDYGLCKKRISNFCTYAINTSCIIDRTKYYKNLLFKLYNNKFDYSLVECKNNIRDKITLICNVNKTHGEFYKPIDLIGNVEIRCPKCSAEKFIINQTYTLDQFVEKANLKHNNKYDYSKSIYTHSKNNINIYCPIHKKEFIQNAHLHLTGSGCQLCANESVSNKLALNPPGWTLTNWINSSKKSLFFDSFKLYILRCWNDEEEFFKIGRTFTTVKKRFLGKNLPYQYEIIKVIENENAKYIYNLENELKRKNKINKYLPKKHFNGKHECFNKIIMEEIKI